MQIRKGGIKSIIKLLISSFVMGSTITYYLPDEMMSRLFSLSKKKSTTPSKLTSLIMEEYLAKNQ
jgi:predicted DNA-binding protein